MDVQRSLAAQLHAHLPNRLEKRQGLDVADRAADLHEADIGARSALHHAALDLVRDVRDNLNRSAEVLAPAFLGDHVRIDLAGREVARPARARSDEALVVPEVEVRLRAVVGDVHLTMLKRAHRPRIHVDVRI